MGRIRFTLLILCVAVAQGLLLYRLYYLQILNGEYYTERAQAQILVRESISPLRGTIYFTDKKGNLFPAATNKQFPYLFAVPKKIHDTAGVSAKLAAILRIPASEIEQKLSNKDSAYALIAKKLSAGVASEIDRLKIPGIFVDTRPERFYPFGQLGSHILGYVGPNPNDLGEGGHYGIEGLYDSVLRGVQAKFEEDGIVSPQDGKDLILTIDPNIQEVADRIISELVEKYKAKGGGAIVMEPSSGRILALVGIPQFDPNSYSESSVETFLNPMVQKIYEPGSVVKILTMAAGIDSGKITPDTSYVDKGSLVLDGRRISNFDLDTKGPYGLVDMRRVIENSINTGAVFVQQTIGRELFRNYLERFGLGEKTGVALPGELEGSLKNLNPNARNIAFATASYGHGISVTPLGLLRAVAVIANGGKLVRPLIFADEKPEEIRQVIKEDTAVQITKMMVSAVDKARVAKLSGYTLAGKTGTALVPDTIQGGYTDRVINTYVGFGPAINPRFIALLKLDEPEGAPVAALTVVPAFRELAQFILNYYNVPPDRLSIEEMR